TLPQQRGAMTVSDVLAAPAGDRRDAMIRQWCVSVWAAWGESYAQVRAPLRATLASLAGRAQSRGRPAPWHCRSRIALCSIRATLLHSKPLRDDEYQRY